MINPGQWYELRVEGSAGTQAGDAKGATEIIAIGENGRLISITLGRPKKFESKQQAMDYLNQVMLTGDYRFEAVLCGAGAAK
ncbi:MAG: hypothetical protein Q8L40_05080 [Burkholderiales bacterium]|nr:hypothetical protein [Burkholderiales bacterium]